MKISTVRNSGNVGEQFPANGTPKTVFINNIDENSVRDFYNQFQEALNNGQQVIPVVIDSYGGEVYSALGIVDIIKSSKIPVATVAVGKAMSAGAIILAYGHKGLRFCTENTTVMLHDMSAGIHGKTGEMKSTMKHFNSLYNNVFKDLSLVCGQDSKYFDNMFSKSNNTDIYMSSKDAKKHGIVDIIGVPNLEIKTETKYVLSV